MDSNFLFDSKKHIRKVPVIISVYDGTGTVVFCETLEFTRVIIADSKYYKRILFQTPDVDIENSMISIQKLLLEKKASTGDKSYISLSIKPKGISEEDTVVCFIDDSFTVFSETFTKCREKVLSACLNSETFIVLNGTRIYDKKYEDCIINKSNLDEQEITFVKNAVQKQNADDWFPSFEEMKSTKKMLKNNEKIMSKKETGGFFKPKKQKTQEQLEIVSESGEYINPKSLKLYKGSANPDYELSNIIGLESVKKDIQKMKYMLEYEQNRKERGISSHDTSSLHMCFLGHPGTGKTTIARIMTGILFSMGYIKENKCIEVNGLDLQGGYVGQTAIITKQIIETAKGGILFIDEAYALCENKENSFGKEAISVLLKEMEDNRDNLIVIFAGYEDDMNKFLNVNPGFRSRINKYFSFADYTTIELGNIFLNYIKKMHLKINEESMQKCIEIFKSAKKQPNFSNGRFVRNLSEKIEETHILHSVDDTDKRMDEILIEDIPDSLVKDVLYGI